MVPPIDRIGEPKYDYTVPGKVPEPEAGKKTIEVNLIGKTPEQAEEMTEEQ
jgi:hypothetical protein